MRLKKDKSGLLIPERRPECSYYFTCIDEAARKDVKHFSCKGCSKFCLTPPISGIITNLNYKPNANHHLVL